MKLLFCVALGLALARQAAAQQPTPSTPFDAPPEWAKQAIWYQVFVERFRNGDRANDPTPANINTPPVGIVAPPGWSVTPWTHNWHQQETWAKKTGKSLQETIYLRRFGGDLQGLLDKLDYLQELGVNALFLNPINDASSLHKYDARYYHHVDVNFGPDPAGDNAIIARENPADVATWQWTSADRLFLKLVDEVHRRGMKIILDYSWNHTGTLFWAWQDVLANQAKSPYKDWYEIQSFDDPETPESEFKYSGWAGVRDLPEIKKVNLKSKRENGRPYEGDIHPGPKQHIFDVARRWLAPNGDPSKGIDGFRLDVADQIGLEFWRDFRKVVRAVQPDAYLVGEIWWEKWPDQLMNPVPYTKGDMFDAVMFYQVYRPARYFFAKTDFDIDAKQLQDSLNFQWKRLSVPVRQAMMNVSSSHDAPRLLTCFGNPNKYKFQANTHENPAYHVGKPTEETFRRLRLYLVHLFTTIGAPQIWNGEEMGMWGADDPHCRKPLWWPDYTFAPEVHAKGPKGARATYKVGFNRAHFEFYKKLIALRKSNPALQSENFSFLPTTGKILAYKRWDKSDTLWVVFNAGTGNSRFVLPEKGTYLDLLTNKKISGDAVLLPALSALILKKL